jgi:hypothetical protein
MRPHLPLVLAVLLLLISLSTTTTAQSDQTVLQPGTPLQRTISPGESHTFTIDLSDEQYLQFVVNQHGVDLIVRVFSPTGKSLGDFDTPNGAEGPENVAIVAVSGGSYRIVVSPLDSNGVREPGKYEIKTIEIRQATDQELKVGKNDETRKAKGLALLNDIVDSIPEIRLPQTRLRVKLQSASVLWTIDEKKAAKLLAEGLTECRDYLASLKPGDDSYEQAYQWVQRLRFEAVQTVAFHDPEEALNLFRATRNPIDRDAVRDDQESERQFEMSLAAQIATRNPKRAYELAEESLKTGNFSNLFQMLTQLRQSDQELANSLVKDMWSKIMEEKLIKNPGAAELAFNLIRNSPPSTKEPAANTNQNTSSLLSQQDYKALIQKVLSDALSVTKPAGGFNQETSTAQMLLMSLKMSMSNELESIVPGSTASIQKKLSEMGGGVQTAETWHRYDEAIENSSADAAKETISEAPPELRGQLVQKLIDRNLRAGDFSQAKTVLLENITNPRERRQALNNLERQAAYTDVTQGRIEEALKHVRRFATEEDRASFIAETAPRIGPGQKRAAALALLETARSILGTSIRAENQSQMFALLQLAAAFSRYDAKRGFEILEPLVDQFNDLCEAARTLNGFGSTFFVDGEFSMQNDNGLATIAPSLGNALGILSLVDFDRAKTVADRIHLPEVRLPVHLNLAQQAIMPSGIYSPGAANLNSLNR